MAIQPKLRQHIIVGIISVCFLITPSISCQASKYGLVPGVAAASVQRGNITVTVTAAGRLEMPNEVKLRFPTPGTVTKIFVAEGDKVKAGKLLAKLDDTAQKLAVAQAQYSVEVAMNELVEKQHASILGFPYYYPPTTALFRLEQAQDDLAQAQDAMQASKYRQAMAGVRLAIYDLNASLDLLQPPSIISLEDYPYIVRAIELLQQDINALQSQGTPLGVQGLLEKGSYQEASARLAAVQGMVEKTRWAVNGIVGVIKSYSPPYPDSATTIDTLKQVEEALQKIQKLIEQGNYDAVELAQTLRSAQHDVEMSNSLLETGQLLFKHGINLKLLRLNNLNLAKADKALQSAKAELMKTEILAPFDGVVVDVGVKENDQLSAVDYTTKIIVDLVDTSNVEMDGLIDETDVTRIATGQSATITVDALPGQRLQGKVLFISPYGSTQAGSATFEVKIQLDRTDKLLQRGLYATADIVVDKRNNVLLIPNGAIKGSPGNYWVSVMKNEMTGDTEKRPITTGIQNREFTEVTSGLNEGEKVLLQTLRQ